MIVAKIKKNSNIEIRISLDEYKGKSYINVREYFKNKAEFLPTKKGFNLIIDKKQDLIKLISSLKQDNLDKKIYEFELSTSYKFQAGRAEYMNYQYYEIRKYYLNEESKKWIPTKHGITFREELIDEVYNAIKSIP